MDDLGLLCFCNVGNSTRENSIPVVGSAILCQESHKTLVTELILTNDIDRCGVELTENEAILGKRWRNLLRTLNNKIQQEREPFGIISSLSKEEVLRTVVAIPEVEVQIAVFGAPPRNLDHAAEL